MSARRPIAREAYGRTTPIFMHAARGHGSVFLWRHRDMFSTSGLRMTSILYRGAIRADSSKTLYFEDVHQVAVPWTSENYGVSPNSHPSP